MEFGNLHERPVSSHITRFAQYCLDLAEPRELPRRSDFDPDELRWTLGNVFLIDVLPEERDYYFSLFGVRMSVLHGNDLTQMCLSEIEGDDLRNALREIYDGVVAAKKPCFMRGRYMWPDKSVGIEILLVPMTDDEGRLTAISGIAIPGVSDEKLAMFEGDGPTMLILDQSRQGELFECAS